MIFCRKESPANWELHLDWKFKQFNEYRGELIEKFLAKMAPAVGNDPEKLDQLRAFEGVLRSSAEYSLSRIKARYGTYPAFFEAEFGLDEDKVRELRAYYLTAAQ